LGIGSDFLSWAETTDWEREVALEEPYPNCVAAASLFPLHADTWKNAIIAVSPQPKSLRGS
jgi:hypothetical protein